MTVRQWSLLATVLACAVPSTVHAEREPRSLAGISEVVFSVNSFGSNAQPVLGVLEGNLRGAGLRLRSQDDADQNVPRLNLDMYRVCRNEHCGFAMSLELTQRVRLARNVAIQCSAITWSDGMEGAVPESQLSELMDLYAQDAEVLMKEFLVDYTTANAKK